MVILRYKSSLQHFTDIHPGDSFYVNIYRPGEASRVCLTSAEANEASEFMNFLNDKMPNEQTVTMYRIKVTKK